MSAMTVCCAVLKITDEELDGLEKMARGQLAYFSPLKMATMGRQRALGQHNLAVLAKLRELRDTIKAGESLGRSNRRGKAG
jgi:hypothetical protein